MPEGDSLALAATRVGEALQGELLVKISGSAPAIRREGRRMLGREVVAVRSVGKHLLIELDNAWTLRTHLGMTGSWHVYVPDERWGRSPGKARVVLSTARRLAVCFAAPTVELAPSDRVMESLGRLGPDLLADPLDVDEIVRRSRTAPGPTVADLLLDQRVMAGVGNVYKSETLFLERLHPDTPVAELSERDIRRLVNTAARLLRANIDTAVRSTTGSRARGRRMWVYDRARRGCRRCPDPIVSSSHGELDRVTYWCPTCQRRTS